MLHGTKPEVEHHQVTYRIPFDSLAAARRLAAVDGPCRFVRNEMLDQQAQLADIAGMCGAKVLTPTFFALCDEFTQLAPLRCGCRSFRSIPSATRSGIRPAPGSGSAKVRSGTLASSGAGPILSRFHRMRASRTVGCTFRSSAGSCCAGTAATRVPTGCQSRRCPGAWAGSGWPRSATRSQSRCVQTAAARSASTWTPARSLSATGRRPYCCQRPITAGSRPVSGACARPAGKSHAVDPDSAPKLALPRQPHLANAAGTMVVAD